MLSACGGSSAHLVAGTPSLADGLSSRPLPAQQNLFVENFESIVEYTLDGHRIRTMKKGFTEQSGTRVGGLAFDPSGYLYAITGDFSVSVYAPGSRKLVRILTQNIEWPFSLATDPQGNLYVGNGENNSIAIFSPGASSPSSIITQGVDDPTSLAIDSKENLYAANLFGNSVTVYAPDGRLLRTIVSGANGPEALTIDKHDELYVGDAKYGYGNTVSVYEPPNDRLVQVIGNGVRAPWYLAADSRRRLYVSNANGGSVTVYNARNRKLQRTLKLKKAEPGPLIFDSSDNLYVSILSHPPQVDVYAPGSDSPKFTIAKGIVEPLALAIGPP